MKNTKPLHERLRGLVKDERCIAEMLASAGIGEDDCSASCDECLAKVFETLADEIEQNYELREGAYAPKSFGIGADGLPICEGDEVYVAPEHAGDCGKGRYELGYDASLVGYRYGEMRHAVANGYKVGLELKVSNSNDWCLASWLTHTPPDTQERIDEEKMFDLCRYWRCIDVDCTCCTLGGDGINPAERYGVLTCAIAQGMDIARRQAELDALLGGAMRDAE